MTLKEFALFVAQLSCGCNDLASCVICYGGGAEFEPFNEEARDCKRKYHTDNAYNLLKQKLTEKQLKKLCEIIRCSPINLRHDCPNLEEVVSALADVVEIKA